MNDLLALDIPAQVEMDTDSAAQQPELLVEKGTQVFIVPERKNARVQTSQRTKSVGTCIKCMHVVLFL